MNESAQPAGFPTTRWSRVAHAVNPAVPEARAALAELCGAYWYPIYAFIRRKGHDPDLALDLTQDYFARLLETGVLASVDHREGRFRAFLRTDCDFFLSHHHEHRRALKRGGGRPVLPIDARDAEGRYLREPIDATMPERLFDQTWAFNLLDDVLKQLAREYAETGRPPSSRSSRLRSASRPVWSHMRTSPLGWGRAKGRCSRRSSGSASGTRRSSAADRRHARCPQRSRDRRRDPRPVHGGRWLICNNRDNPVSGFPTDPL